jgi:hypothetical protein
MSQSAVAPGEYSLAYDPMRFNLKSAFVYENNTISIRKNRLTQRHNELTDEERKELSNLIIVEEYLKDRIKDLKKVT